MIIDMLTDGTNMFLIDYEGGIKIFNPSTNELSSTISYPEIIGPGFSSVFVDNKIFIKGENVNHFDPTENSCSYDIVTHSWSESSPLLIPLFFFAAVVIDDRWIVVDGGMTPNGNDDGNDDDYDYEVSSHNFINIQIIDLP